MAGGHTKIAIDYKWTIVVPMRNVQSCAVTCKSLVIAGNDVGEGTIEFRKLDIDRDGKADGLSLYCPGSGSVESADPCSLSVKLTSGSEFKLEDPRLHLARYKSRIYAVAVAYDGSWERAIRTIYLLDKEGINRICEMAGPRQGRIGQDNLKGKWRGWRGSNPRPSASEADTLSTELQPQVILKRHEG